MAVASCSCDEQVVMAMIDGPSDAPLNPIGPGWSRIAVVYDVARGEIVHTHVVSSGDGDPPEDEAVCHAALEVAALLSVQETTGLGTLAVTGDFDRRGKYKVDVKTQRLVTVAAEPPAIPTRGFHPVREQN
jgi:hypothetical protein